MSANLISQERAKLSIPAAASADDRLIDALIAAVSRAMEKYCARVFSLAAYDETPSLFQQDGRLMLTRFPIQSVESVRHSPAVVCQVQNTDTATNQIARITITSTAFELVRIASGVKVVNTLSYTTYSTLQAMATGINALGNGWSASVVGSATGDYGLWPCAELFIPPWTGDATRGTGSLGCRGMQAPLYLHVGEANSYTWDARGWLILLDNGLLPISIWNPLFAEPFDRSSLARFYRVQYTAGYVEVPEDVQEACCEWLSAMWYLAQRDPYLTNSLSASGVASGYAASIAGKPGDMPDRVKALLTPYRIRRV